MAEIDRREWLISAAGFTAAAYCSGTLAAAAPRQGLTLGYSTYALPNLPTPKAIALLAETGYDSIELACTPDRATAPERLTVQTTRELRRQLADHGLHVSSLMENLRPMDSLQAHQTALERLKRAADLAHQLHDTRPPLIQTVLAGRNWEQQRALCLKRLAEWVEVVSEHQVVLAIKPHRGHAMSRPSEAVWLIKQLGEPKSLRMTFDYSHFVFRGMPLVPTIQEALPYTAHVAVKDAVQNDGRVRFTLPGESKTIDYAKLLKTFYQGGYRGDVCVEVSSQVWRQPDYDARVAQAVCYRNLAAAFQRAEVPRHQRDSGPESA